MLFYRIDDILCTESFRHDMKCKNNKFKFKIIVVPMESINYHNRIGKLQLVSKNNDREII